MEKGERSGRVLQLSSPGASAPETAAPPLVNTVCLYESSYFLFLLKLAQAGFLSLIPSTGLPKAALLG